MHDDKCLVRPSQSVLKYAPFSKLLYIHLYLFPLTNLGKGVYTSQSVSAPYLSKLNFLITDKLILMKLYIVIVYNLIMCMKESRLESYQGR